MKRLYMTCALTGHRSLPPDFDQNALSDRLEQLIEGGCETFLCGMAEGFDLTALSCLARLKREKKFFVEACIPYEGFSRRFSSENRRLFEELLTWCDRETVLFPAYRDGCFLARNRYMVDCADVLLAYCNRTKGGTAYTVNYAERKGVPVILL